MTLMSRVRANRLSRATIFDSRSLHDELIGRSVRGGFATLSGQGLLLIISTLQTMLLARLLTPDDFGLIAMVAVLIGFVAMFKDAGLAAATVQQDEVTHDQLSTLFWVSVGLSVVIAIGLMLVAPLVAKFYGRTELVAVTIALAFQFALGGVTLQHAALLRRHMKFAGVAGASIAGQLIGLLVAVIAAVQGLHYWAIVVGTLSATLVTTCSVFYLCPWVPGLPHRGTGARSMLGVGGYLTGFNFLNYFARNGDNALIGWRLGATQLGYYNRAYNLMMLPISQISGPLESVALPALSRMAEQRVRMGEYYLKVLRLLSVFASPIGAVCFALADEIILVALGSQWRSAIPVFRMLAIGGVVQPLYATQSWLHVASGHADRVLRWGLIATPLIVGSFVIGLTWGIVGVAACYSAVMVVLVWFALSYSGASAGLSTAQVVRSVLWPLSSGVLAALLTFVAVQGPISGLPLLARAAVGLLLFAATYVGLLTKGFRDVTPVHEAKSMLNHLRVDPQPDLDIQAEESPLA